MEELSELQGQDQVDTKTLDAESEQWVEIVKCECQYSSDKPKRMGFQKGDEIYVLKVSQIKKIGCDRLKLS